MKHKIKMIGIDLDGTIFDDHKHISQRTIVTIKRAIGQGVVVLPATGRPLSGIPEELLRIPGMDYVLSSNGAAVHNIRTKEKLYEDCMEQEFVADRIEELRKFDVMPDVFLDGRGYVEREDLDCILSNLSVPELRSYFIKTRKTVEDLPGYLRDARQKVEKMTVNFQTKNGVLYQKEETLRLFQKYDTIAVVSGAPTNIEITKATATKGNGLLMLGRVLGIKREEIMACGDSGNDREMIQAAGLGIAMANATADVKEVADALTFSNNEDGVAAAIEQYVLF